MPRVNAQGLMKASGAVGVREIRVRVKRLVVLLALAQILSTPVSTPAQPTAISFEVGAVGDGELEPRDFTAAIAYAMQPGKVELKAASKVEFARLIQPVPVMPSPTPVEVPPEGDWTTTILLIIIVGVMLLVVGVLLIVLSRRRQGHNNQKPKDIDPLRGLEEEKVRVKVRSASSVATARKAGNYYHEDKSKQPQQSAKTPIYFAAQEGGSQRSQEPQRREELPHQLTQTPVQVSKLADAQASQDSAKHDTPAILATPSAAASRTAAPSVSPLRPAVADTANLRESLDLLGKSVELLGNEIESYVESRADSEMRRVVLFGKELETHVETRLASGLKGVKAEVEGLERRLYEVHKELKMIAKIVKRDDNVREALLSETAMIKSDFDAALDRLEAKFRDEFRRVDYSIRVLTGEMAKLTDELAKQKAAPAKIQAAETKTGDLKG